jgi:PAS domain S-box-containing protein
LKDEGRDPSACNVRPDEAGSQDTYHVLFERSADAILIIEGERFVDCNEATVEMLRLPDKAAVLRTHPSELSPPVQPDGRESYEKANDMIATAFREGSHRFEWDHVRADGEVFPVEVLLTAVEEHGEQKLHVVWRDISERKRLEDQLRQSQKMEALGKLAGGVAHDFNNLLVPILGNSELILESIDEDAAIAEQVRQIQVAGERAAQLVRQLLTFSRKQETQAKVIVLNDTITGLGQLLGRLIGEDIVLKTSCQDDPVQVKVDPGHIEQLVINLATNARDAMPEGGDLAIDLVATRLERTTVIGGLRALPAGDYALLSVSDTGVGMDEKTLRRAFEPFFTTKDAAHGTGLGLATVYGIAQQSGGAASITSRARMGTTVDIYLPITAEGVRPSRSRKSEPTRGGSETILLAEDESAVSVLTITVLRSRGYNVLLARNGEEAFRMWHESDAGQVQIPACCSCPATREARLPHSRAWRTNSTCWRSPSPRRNS